MRIAINRLGNYGHLSSIMAILVANQATSNSDEQKKLHPGSNPIVSCRVTCKMAHSTTHKNRSHTGKCCHRFGPPPNFFERRHCGSNFNTMAISFMPKTLHPSPISQVIRCCHNPKRHAPAQVTRCRTPYRLKKYSRPTTVFHWRLDGFLQPGQPR